MRAIGLASIRIEGLVDVGEALDVIHHA